MGIPSTKTTFLLCGVLVAIVIAVVAAWNLFHALGDGDLLAQTSCRLKWLPQSQFAGNYVAEAKGFYLDAGIECELLPGGQGHSAVKLVAAGSDDFGICGGDEILVARSKGIPVVALAVIYQESPVCFFAKKESGIEKPEDFVGKRVGMQYGTNVRTEYMAMMTALDIPLETVTEVPSRFDMQSFFSGKVDVWNGYTINEVQTAEERGFEVNVIRPFDYGVRMYADCLFATEETITQRPELVRAFVTATVRGWEYAIAHQDETLDIVLRVDRKLNREHERKMLAASVPLITPKGGQEHGVGWMTEQRWAEMEDTLAAQGLISSRVSVEECFTTAFLPPP